MLDALGGGPVDVSEVFCPPRFTAMAANMGLCPGLAMDLVNGWDLDDETIFADWITGMQSIQHIAKPECAKQEVCRDNKDVHQAYGASM